MAHESELVLVKVSEGGRITEEKIAEGIHWVLANRGRYNIRMLKISLGGDEDIPCSIEDPSNGLKAPDNYGGLNSVVVIE